VLATGSREASTRSVSAGVWLMVVAVMIVGQVMLGGITRLTGSGLSITEWKPVVGAIPPLDQKTWEDEFAKYQQIPQFRQLNAQFTLDEFKRIYFWEWLHRLWGRLLGVAFFVPLLVLWRRRKLAGLGPALLALGLLGGFQGFLGWFMVASGLKDLVYVSHLRLAVHFLAAIALLVAVYWVALGQLVEPHNRRVAPGDAKLAWWLVGALGVQLTWGAFVAGLKAAGAAPTWPSMNGAFIPRVLMETPGDLINNPLTVQFIHRMLAYALTVAIVAFWVRLLRLPAAGHWRWTRHAPAWAVFAQVTLGVATVLNVGEPGTFVVLGAAHQLGAVLVVLSLVTIARLSVSASETQVAPSASNSTPDRVAARV
jgi:cytochrome c oxidase assembly protein subunit 15